VGEFVPKTVGFRPVPGLAGFLALLDERPFLGAQGLQFHVKNAHEPVQLLQHLQNLSALRFVEGALIENGIHLAHEAEELRQGRREVQIVAQRLEKALFQGEDEFGECFVLAVAALGVLHAADEFLETVVAAPGVENVLGGDVDRFAVVGGQQPVADFHGNVASGQEITDGEVLVHLAGLLFSLGGPDAFAEHPDIGEGLAG